MTNSTTLGDARRKLNRALDASGDGDRRAAENNLFAGELLLRKAGREDLGYRLPDAATADVTARPTRHTVRQVIDTIEAEENPESATFARASDGGERQ